MHLTIILNILTAFHPSHIRSSSRSEDMSVSGSQYQLQIQALRQEKNQTEDEIKVLADRSSEWQLKVYRLILVINAEIANKHFKEVNSELLLPNRISSAVALMVSYATKPQRTKLKRSVHYLHI